MKVNLDQVLKDFEGDPIKDDKDKPWTLGRVVVSALSTPLDTDKNLSADKAVARWVLATKLYAGGEQELTPEQAAEIRERLPKCYAILLSGQACEMLKG